nr:hypothetical protein [Neorhizobium tomejilense]
MKPGIREDDLLIDVWEACARFDRPQDVFRTMLRRGLRAMVETGDMPKAVRDACGLDAVLEKRRPRNRQEPPDAPVAYPYPPHSGYPPYPPQGYAPYPPQPYAPQVDHGQWRGEDPRQRQHDYGHDRPLAEPARPASYDDPRPVEPDRRAAEEKTPLEPPRPAPAAIPEKRQELPPPQQEAPNPQTSGATYGKAKPKLGNIM